MAYQVKTARLLIRTVENGAAVNADVTIVGEIVNTDRPSMIEPFTLSLPLSAFGLSHDQLRTIVNQALAAQGKI